jgi:hypothetical protein
MYRRATFGAFTSRIDRRHFASHEREILRPPGLSIFYFNVKIRLTRKSITDSVLPTPPCRRESGAACRCNPNEKR